MAQKIIDNTQPPVSPDPLAHLKAIKETLIDPATKFAASEPIVSVEQIEAAAALILNAMSTVDTVWRERIIAIREEKGWDSTRVLFFCAGKTLNMGAHLENFSHHFFDSEAAANPMLLGKSQCELDSCRKVFVPRKPGQKYCSNECGEVIERKQIAEARRQAELAANRRHVMKDGKGAVVATYAGTPEGDPSPPLGRITREVAS